MTYFRVRGFIQHFPGRACWFFDREDPYWFKRSTSFLGIFLCWSRCQHAQDPWFAMSVTSPHAHGWPGAPGFPGPGRSHRVGSSLSGLDVQIPFYGMQSFAYSPAPGSGGSLRSLIYPGPRRLHRPTRSGYSVFRCVHSANPKNPVFTEMCKFAFSRICAIS